VGKSTRWSLQGQTETLVVLDDSGLASSCPSKLLHDEAKGIYLAKVSEKLTDLGPGKHLLLATALCEEMSYKKSFFFNLPQVSPKIIFPVTLNLKGR
jgi:hypothetical protein